jgi:hypothetical protein
VIIGEDVCGGYKFEVFSEFFSENAKKGATEKP